jgi:hypothetical protein
MEHEHDQQSVMNADVLRRLEAIELGCAKTAADTQRITIEQGHIKELFTTRLGTIDTGQSDMKQQLRTLSDNLQSMWADSEKTPAGRALRDAIGTVAATVDEHTALIERHAITHADLKQWRDRVDGVLYLLKWVGIGGLITTGLAIMNFMKAKGGP